MPGTEATSVKRSRLKSEIQRAFKMYGFQLRIDACKHLEDLLSALDSSEWREWIDKILDILQRKSDLESSVVGKEVLDKAIQVRKHIKLSNRTVKSRLNSSLILNYYILAHFL